MLTVMWLVSSNFIPSEVSSWQRTWVTRVSVSFADSKCGYLEGQDRGFAPTQSAFALAWMNVLILI